MKGLKRSVTFWLLVAFAATWVLLALPIVGFLVMLTNAASWMGWLLQLALLAMFLEALAGRIPRVFVVLPLLFYGYFYYLYFQDQARFSVAKEAMELEPAKELMVFDPAVQTLRTQLAITEILATYTVPVAYVNNAKAIYRYTIATDPKCDPPGTREPTTGYVATTVYSLYEQFCFEQVWIEPPPGPLVEIDLSWEWPKVGLSAIKRVIAVKRDGEVLGQTSSGRISVLKPFPVLQFGCGTGPVDADDDAPCDTRFLRDHIEVSADGDPERVSARIAKMLALTPRTPEDIASRVYVPAAPDT